MVEFFLDRWGDLFSVIGVFVSAVGLWLAFREARRARREAQNARSAAIAAEKATIETRNRIGRHLVTIDLQRAVGLIQRLKLLHSANRWDAALEQYQSLRAIISDIIARYPELDTGIRRRLSLARHQIRRMEDLVEDSADQGLETDEWVPLNHSLNEIQSDLESIASTMEFGELERD